MCVHLVSRTRVFLGSLLPRTNTYIEILTRYTALYESFAMRTYNILDSAYVYRNPKYTYRDQVTSAAGRATLA